MSDELVTDEMVERAALAAHHRQQATFGGGGKEAMRAALVAVAPDIALRALEKAIEEGQE